MTTTQTALGWKSVRLAFSIVVEGLPLAFTTADVANDMATAWAGTDWAGVKWRTTAFLPGEVTQRIELFNPQIKPDALSIRVLDNDGTLVALIAKIGARQGAKTFLTADLDCTTTTATVLDTSTFPATGLDDLYCGNETWGVDYGLKTGTTFPGLTRGKYSLFTTSTGGRMARPHRINKANSLRPIVANCASTHYNRGVAVYLHHYENGAWSTKANALLFWAGRIKSIADNRDKSFTFNMQGILESLQTQLLADQFTAVLMPGMYVPSGWGYGRIREFVPAGVSDVTANFQVPGLNTNQTADQLINGFNFAAQSAGLKYRWSMSRAADQDGVSKVKLTASTANVPGAPANPDSAEMRVALHYRIWQLLGFNITGTQVAINSFNGATYHVLEKNLKLRGIDNGNAIWELVAENAPVVYYFPAGNVFGYTVTLAGAGGTWSPQTSPPSGVDRVPIPANITGFLQVGDSVMWAGIWTPGANNTGTFLVQQDVTQLFTAFGLQGGAVGGDGLVREGQTGTIYVRQVWFENGPIYDVLLRLLLSTGTTGYNDPTYDRNPTGMGVAIPSSLLDAESVRGMGSETCRLIINQPTELVRVLESVLAVQNRFLVWKGGKYTVVEPRADGPSIAVAFALTESNKAAVDDVIDYSYSPDGLINRIELKYDRRLDGSFGSDLVVEDLVSTSDFGQRKAVTVEGWGIPGNSVNQFIDHVASKALAYFSRPLIIATRTIDRTMFGLIGPCDTVLVTDNYLPDFRAGTRGVTSMPAWVLGATFDPSKMAGVVTLAFSPEFDVDKICAWGWSARIDETQANAGYDVANKRITVYPHQYSMAAEAADDTYAFAGHALRVRELSPQDPKVPLLWHVTVASVDTVNHRLTFNEPLTGWDSTRKYIVEPDTIGAVVQAQKATAFLAADETNSTGAARNDAYLWGAQAKYPGSVAAPVYTQQYVKPPEASIEDAQGDPVSVADWVEMVNSINNLLWYKTRQVVWSDWASTVPVGVNNWVIYGPVWVPLMNGDTRHLKVLLYRTGPGTLLVSASKVWFGGVSFQAVDYSLGQVTQVKDINASGVAAWSAELTLTVYPVPDTPPGVWLWVEGTPDTSTLMGIAVVEEAA